MIARQTDLEGWKKEKRYGDGWTVEGAHSVIKRIFGEYVSAKKFVNMAKEMATYEGIALQHLHADDTARRRIVIEHSKH